ncbi:MAG: hypothetical protein RIF41_40985 [Polyangiaceae bacterium]
MTMRTLGVLVMTLGTLGAVALGCNDPEVRYGPVGGLRVRGGGVDDGNACAYPPGTDETGTTCPPWTEVYAIFNDPAVGCTLSNCHGVGSLFAPTMPEDDPILGYENMKAYLSAEGRPYVSENAQNTAFLLCNIWQDAPTQIGSPMPRLGTPGIAPITAADLETIGNWVACGMLPDGGGGVGGGGIGGDVGLGGAGGML